MATGENGELAVQVAELRVEMRTEIRHVKEDIAEIKTDLRDFKKSTEERFTRLDGKVSDLEVSILSVKLWAFRLYIAFAGTLLYVIAKSVKWL